MSTALIKITNVQVFNQFLHNCVNDLIDYKEMSYDTCSSDIEWTLKDYLEATNFIKNLYRQMTLNSESNFELNLDKLNPNFQDCIQNCYEIRKNEIFQALAKQGLFQEGKSVVENIDWKLKWIMGTSSLAALKQPILQLDLHCFKKPNEMSRKTVNFEMNLEEIDSLIAQLEKVKNELSEN